MVSMDRVIPTAMHVPRVPGGGRVAYAEARGVEVRQVWQTGYWNDRDRDFHHTFDRHLNALIDALERSESPPIHAHAGRRALALAHAAIRSFRSGRRVEVT